jgi:hypothetical protein
MDSSRLSLTVALAAVGVLALAGSASALAAGPALGGPPSCFGAAARDAQHRCRNPRLTLAVVPSPRQARRLPNAPCTIVERDAVVQVCAFGVAPQQADATIALVGDSHATHWRAALEPVAQAKQWQGLSITHTSCPLSKAVRDLPEPDRSGCIAWKRGVFRWFARHPEVRTVFVSELSGGSGVVASHGRSPFATAVAGYRAAWSALPRSVEHIVVIRDTPKAGGDLGACIERALGRRRPPGTACARSRVAALDRDPAIAAAARARPPRIRTVDLTRFFCGPERCYPVIGGALVNKDPTHITATYGATLGPYLLRSVDHLMTSWR